MSDYNLLPDERYLKVLPKNGEMLTTTQIAIRLQVGNGTVAKRMLPLVESGQIEKVQLAAKQWGYKLCM